MTEPQVPVTDRGHELTGAGEPERPSFGQRLRRFRERAGLSQAALAGDNLHPSYVSLLESDRRPPTEAVLRLFAARLGVSVEELSGDATAGLEERLLLADAAVATGHPADAVAALGDLTGGISGTRLSVDPTAFRALEVLATALERTGDLDAAAGILERLREAAEGSPARLPWLPVTVALVRCYRDAGDLGRAVDLGEQAMRRYQELRLEGLDGHAALVSTLAGVYSDRGDHLRAKVLLDALIAETDAAGERDDRAYAYWNAALNAAERGYAGEGRRLAERASALLAEGEDLRSQARLPVTRAWLLLAETPQNAREARTVLRAAMPRVRQHAGAGSLASAETELARCELLLGRPEVARRLARSALTRLAADRRIGRARALTALGAALVALGEETAGVSELEAAATALSEVESPRQAAAVWRQLAGVYRSLGDPEKALEAADRAMDAAGLTNEQVAVAPVGSAPGAPTAKRQPVSRGPGA